MRDSRLFRWATHFKVALGPHEISAKFRVAEKKLGQNLTVQIDCQNFCMSREFAGGATLRLSSVKLALRLSFRLGDFWCTR